MSSLADRLTRREITFVAEHYTEMSERSLAACMGVSRELVHQAVLRLAAEGRIDRRSDAAAPLRIEGAPPRRLVDAGTRWHIGEWFERWGYKVEWRPVGGRHLPHLDGRRTTIAVLCQLWDEAWRRENAARR